VGDDLMLSSLRTAPPRVEDRRGRWSIALMRTIARSEMSTVILHNVVSVDGYIAQHDDLPGPLFDWYFNGDHHLVAGQMADPAPGGMRVSKASFDYVRALWDELGAMVIGRHLFDFIDGWGGRPPA